MPLHEGAKPGSKEFGENVATEVHAGKPQKQAVAIAYSEAERHTKDADDPDIAPSVAETEARAPNRVPPADQPLPGTRPGAAAPAPMDASSGGLAATKTYQDPGFRNPTADTAQPRQVGASLSSQNAANRAYWANRK